MPASTVLPHGPSAPEHDSRAAYRALERPPFKNCRDPRRFHARLALQEEAKTMPFGVVWYYYCEQKGVPPGACLALTK